MVKPEVPTGAITFDSRPPRISADGLGKQLTDLLDDGVLEGIQTDLDRGHWAEAEFQLWHFADRIGRARLEAERLATVIHRQMRSPLLEQEDANG